MTSLNYFEGMIVIRLFVVLWMPTLAKGTIIVNISDVLKCNEASVSLMDEGGVQNHIMSPCNCTIISHYKGTLTFKYNKTCRPHYNILDGNRKLIHTICNGTGSYNYFTKDVNKDDKLFLLLRNVNDSFTRQRNPQHYQIRIYTGLAQSGKFSVACSSTPRFNAGTTTISESTTPTFKDMYVVAAVSILVVVAFVVFVVVCIRRRTRASNTSKEDTDGARVHNNATNGVERPDTSGTSKKLPDSPLYHSYQENDDSGYSACGNENQNLTEQPPDNPLYHSYKVNDDKEDSKNEKDNKSVHQSSQGEMASYRNPSIYVSDSNVVYAQPNKIAKVSNANQDEYTEDQNETVYAQVSKPKKQ